MTIYTYSQVWNKDLEVFNLFIEFQVQDFSKEKQQF